MQLSFLSNLLITVPLPCVKFTTPPSYIGILATLIDYATFLSEFKFMFVMHVSLRGVSPVGCSRYNYFENEMKAAASPMLFNASAKHPASISFLSKSYHCKLTLNT